MNYRQTLDYLYAQLPMFHRIGAAAYKADLHNTLAICKALGNPEKKLKCIHIAGTNGKGSVSHMLAAVLQSAGYKTGLYTSPHLKDFRERVKVNGKMIPQKRVIRFVQQHKKDFERIAPSFFEWTVGLAFDHFVTEKVDIAVIETGLGGRLDSTNVIDPVLSIITNISYDHQNLLGGTLQKIAAEKAGVIKKNRIVIVSEKQQETRKVFERKAETGNALLLFTGDHISNVSTKGCGLKGKYQEKNIPTVILASEVLHQLGYQITSSHIKKGLKDVIRITGLRGRWDILSKHPLTVADIAHNEVAIKEVIQQVRIVPHKNLHIVLGAVNDKDISKILTLLPKKAAYYFCKANIPRALDENVLAGMAKKAGLEGGTFSTVKQALAAARSEAAKKDLILVTGSAFVVAEVI